MLDGNPTLLLLHAAGMDRTSWDTVVERIPRFAPTVAIDLPGHGGLPGLSYDDQIVPRLAEYVADHVATLGLHRPHVVGHSLGGAVALELACRVPVAAVTAFCSIGFRDESRVSFYGARVRGLTRALRAVAPALREGLLRSPLFRRLVMSGLSARPSAIHADLAVADARALVHSDIVPLTQFACRYRLDAPERLGATPVNLVWAMQDRVVSRGDAGRARLSLPHAQHTAVLGSGHLVMRDDPEITAAVIHSCHSQVMRELQRGLMR